MLAPALPKKPLHEYGCKHLKLHTCQVVCSAAQKQMFMALDRRVPLEPRRATPLHFQQDPDSTIETFFLVGGFPGPHHRFKLLGSILDYYFCSWPAFTKATK